MKKRGTYYIMSMLIAVLPMLVSCRQELCFDHYPSIDVQLSWEQEWERDYGAYHLDDWDEDYFGHTYDHFRPYTPEWVNMRRYYPTGQTKENYLTPDGKKFEVEEDRECSMLLYNGDTEFIVLSDVASLNEARASATSRSRSRAALEIMLQKHVNARTTNPPDILYSAYIDNVPGLKSHQKKEMPVKMQPLVYSYVITYEFEYGIQHVALARGAIGGMAESVYLRTGATSKESSIILFDCEVKSNGVQAHVRSFGIPDFPDVYYGRTQSEVKDQPYTLNLEVMLKNGTTVVYDFDITDQVKKQPRGGVIKVGGLRIEDEQNQPNSGFKVEVNEWDDNSEVVDLPIGDQPGAI